MDKEKEKKLSEKYLNNWKRERADFLNYRKEERERINKAIEYNNEELILELLLILDNIYIAENNLSKDLKNNSWVQGMLKIKAQIIEFLKRQGVKEIECLGKQFDPNVHEAVGEVKKGNVKPGVIIEEIKKGYFLNGKVLRPAMVKIAK